MDKKQTKFKAEILKERIKAAGTSASELSITIGRSKNYISTRMQKETMPVEDWTQLNAILDAKIAKAERDGAPKKEPKINKGFAKPVEKPADPKKNERAIINIEQSVRKLLVTVDRIIEDVNKAKAHLDVIDKYMLMTDKKIEELQANDRVLLEEIEALKTEKKKGLLSRFMK